ncbi:MAG: hypothetical protein KAS72_14265 [Phycisphaerales bacterium]|nr:hypothetical protein [Phycisphaerales bacterium]
MLTWPILLTCLLIFLARVVDVSMGTLRTVWIVQGRRWSVFFLGFVEVLIWVVAVSQVITNLDNPFYAIFYALGFATGNYLGVVLEQRLAYGEQVIRIFTRKGTEIADVLRKEDFGVTVFHGEGRDAPIDMCFIETRRRNARLVVARARALDPACYYVIDTVQLASTAPRPAPEATGWRAVRKKK